MPGFIETGREFIEILFKQGIYSSKKGRFLKAKWAWAQDFFWEHCWNRDSECHLCLLVL